MFRPILGRTWIDSARIGIPSAHLNQNQEIPSMTRPKKNSPAQKSKSNPTMPSAAENPMHSFLEDVAVIEVHAVGFRDVFTARGTGPKHRGSDYRLAMPRWHPGVTLKGKSTVVVTGGPVTIAFYF